jgi:hypothetical protein
MALGFEGKTKAEIEQALADGKLDELLAVADRPAQAPGTQKGSEWVRDASSAQINEALINGDLKDLLQQGPGFEPEPEPASEAD